MNKLKNFLLRIGEKKHIHLALLVAIMTLLYSNTLDNGYYHRDDAEYYFNNPNLFQIDSITGERTVSINWKKLPLEPEKFMFHPVTMYTIGIWTWLFGFGSIQWHALSIFLFGLCIIVAYFLLSILLKSFPKIQKKILNPVWFIFLVCLIWAISPIQTESVAFGSTKKDLLYTLFGFLSLSMYVNFLHTIHNDSKKRFLFYLLTLVTFTLSLLSKPQAVMLPLLFILVTVFYDKSLLRKLFILIIPFILGSYLITTKTLEVQSKLVDQVKQNGIDELLKNDNNNFYVKGYSLFIYTMKTIVPLKLTTSYMYPTPDEPFSFWLKYGWIVVVFLLFILILKRKNEFLLFFSLFFVLSLLPILQLSAYGLHMVQEHYVLFGSLAIFSIFVYCIQTIEKILIRRIFLSIYCIFCCYGTFHRNQDWEQTNKGDLLLAQNIQNKKMLERDYLINHDYSSCVNLSKLYCSLKDWENGLLFAEKAYEMNPRSYQAISQLNFVLTEPEVLLNKKNVIKQQHIREDFKKKFSNDVSVYYKEILAFADSSEFTKALSLTEEALRIKPNDPLLIKFQKDFNERILAVTKNMVIEKYNTAVSYSYSRKFNDVLLVTSEIIWYADSFPQIYGIRAHAFYNLGNYKEALHLAMQLKKLLPNDKATDQLINQINIMLNLNNHSVASNN